MNDYFSELIENEIERRAADRAAQMFHDYLEHHGKSVPELPIDIAPDGTIIRPFIISGIKYVNRKDAAALLGVQFPALWRWTRDGIIKKRKLGRKVYYLYDEVKNLLAGDY